jgi:transposase
MSLHPQHPIPPVPKQTARIAQAAFPKGSPYLTLRDKLGTVFADRDFADLYPEQSQPGYPPWRLALITVMQFREGLSDRQAADAVRARIDWKYLLGLELSDPGFDFSVLSEFRDRLLAGGAAERLLERLLETCRECGLLKARGRQRTDSTHVLAAMRVLNRIELVAETLRAALNATAAAAPDWLRELAPPAWYERYGRRIEDTRLPQSAAQRDAYARQVGEDGFCLLDALQASGAPDGLAEQPAIHVLRKVWARHFERSADGSAGSGGARLRQIRGRGQDGDRLESPYELDARYRAKSGMSWTGYMVHLTESCDADAPRLTVHVETTPASVHEATRTGAIHDALAAKGLTPSIHLVDAGYVSAEQLVSARDRHGIDLVGPARKDVSWQHRTKGAFGFEAFEVDWQSQQVRCPEGQLSMGWDEYRDKARGRIIKVRFSPSDCLACPSKARCTRAKAQGRQLSLHTRDMHEALAAARARQADEAERPLYRLRAGIEGTLSQGVRAFGLRQARYRGLAKMHLQNLAAAVALNLDRLAAWLEERPLAPTRKSRFAMLAA